MFKIHQRMNIYNFINVIIFSLFKKIIFFFNLLVNSRKQLEIDLHNFILKINYLNRNAYSYLYIKRLIKNKFIDKVNFALSYTLVTQSNLKLIKINELINR